MFLQSAKLLRRVGDLIDDVLVGDFEFEQAEWDEWDAEAQAVAATLTATAAPGAERAPAGPCDGWQRVRSPQPVLTTERRPGTVPPPSVGCDLRVPQR